MTRSLTVTCLNGIPNGLTQKQSLYSGSRAVMWPDTPSSNPDRPKIRSAPASRSLRCRRSSSTESCIGGMANRSWSVGSGRGGVGPCIGPPALGLLYGAEVTFGQRKRAEVFCKDEARNRYRTVGVGYRHESGPYEPGNRLGGLPYRR